MGCASFSPIPIPFPIPFPIPIPIPNIGYLPSCLASIRPIWSLRAATCRAERIVGIGNGIGIGA